MSNGKQELYLELRKKHPVFIYHGYQIAGSGELLCLDYHFEIPGLAEFRPHWEIAKPGSFAARPNDKRLDALVFSLGLVELVSYWKTTCSPKVHINCGTLGKEQTDWWKKLYKKGLGEFFYTNGIDAGDDYMDIVSEGDAEKRSGTKPESKGAHSSTQAGILAGNGAKVLIPIGGGKDSAVTLELLKGYAERFCYMINPRGAMLETTSIGEIPGENVVVAKRTLDEKMLALNRQGYLNGHTPFSAIVAFSSVIAAYVHGIEFIALSNESSANEPTVYGGDVNHQYSKSLEFESDFISYEARYIGSGVSYFSLLRPLTELGIAGIFSGFEKYHKAFRSCNAGSKQDVWCAGCAKCLFVYIILSPFLSVEAMINIFGRNMQDDTDMLPVFKKLIGSEPEKPFECVGSRDEVNAALQELVRQYEASGIQIPALLDYYNSLGIEEKYDFDKMCRSFDENNHVPDRFLPAIKNALD